MSLLGTKYAFLISIMDFQVAFVSRQHIIAIHFMLIARERMKRMLLHIWVVHPFQILHILMEAVVTIAGICLWSHPISHPLTWTFPTHLFPGLVRVCHLYLINLLSHSLTSVVSLWLIIPATCTIKFLLFVSFV